MLLVQDREGVERVDARTVKRAAHERWVGLEMSSQIKRLLVLSCVDKDSVLGGRRPRRPLASDGAGKVPVHKVQRRLEPLDFLTNTAS